MTATHSPTNAWRTVTPGPNSWTRTIRADDPQKYFVVSADCHANEPAAYLADYIEPEYRERIPHLEVRPDGSRWSVTEGNRPMMVRPSDESVAKAKGENRHWGSKMEPEDVLRNATGRTMEERLADQTADGIDVELIFPNKGLLCWATPDPVFADAMCRAWNRWAYDFHGGAGGWYGGRSLPLASIATGDLDCALRAVRWAAERGFRRSVSRQLPGLRPEAVGTSGIQRSQLRAIVVADRRDGPSPDLPRVDRPRSPGRGRQRRRHHQLCLPLDGDHHRAACPAASPPGCSSATRGYEPAWSRSGIGFVPWLLETMDYAYKAHHFWVRPVIPEPPSAYFRRNCFATFQEDHEGLSAIEPNELVENVMWANDYPHHEGSWPHSAATVERQMNHLSDEAREKILGLNAKRVFNL